jgi:pantetheine-phosphate adenylyltransferase
MSKPKKHACICAGSFDPPTFGHINIIKRGLNVFDHVVVALARNSSKSALFSVDERVDIIQELFKNESRVTVETFEGLLVNYAKERQVFTLLRGIRTVADYEFELQMSLANRILEPSIETVFIMTEGKFSHISSSIIKEVISLGGSGKDMVHPFIEDKLKAKLLKKRV